MQPRLEIRHLALVDALAEVGSLSGAAELLGVTQSALSHRLREAERRLGARLCRRSGRLLLLTPAGERLRLSARRLLGDLLRVEAELRQMTEAGIRQVARLGQGTYAGLQWLPGFFDWAADTLPDLQIEIVGGVGENGVARLHDGSLDVLLVAGTPLHQGLRLTELGQDSLVAVAAPDHPWAAMTAVPPEALRSETFLSYSFEVAHDLENVRFMQPADCYPARVRKIGQPEAVLELVAAGHGVSILANWPLRPWLRRGAVVARPLLPRDAARAGLPLSWWAAVRRDDDSGDAGPRLAEGLARWMSESGDMQSP